MNDKTGRNFLIYLKSDIGIPLKINIFNFIEIVEVEVEFIVHTDIFHQLGSHKTRERSTHGNDTARTPFHAKIFFPWGEVLGVIFIDKYSSGSQRRNIEPS